MITTNIYGGLGNQMFQYACGHAVASKKNSELTIANDFFKTYNLHNGYELHKVFDIPNRIQTTSELSKLIKFKTSILSRKVLCRPQFKIFRGTHFIAEPHSGYWEGIKLVRDDIYLHGYWQSYKYFSENSDALRSVFQFKNIFSKKNIVLKSDIQGSDSVSVHIRRGDYVSNLKNSSVYSICDLDYYVRALSQISSAIPNPRFFFFSDDPVWVKQVLAPLVKNYCLISHNTGEDSHLDMQLMSLCKHHIVANSTFSWWGAWLNPNPQKMIVAPIKWFARENDNPDLIPKSWLRV